MAFRAPGIRAALAFGDPMSTEIEVPEPPSTAWPFPEELRRPHKAVARYLRRIRSLFGGDDAYALLLAAIVGTATGLGALGFRRLVQEVTHLSFGNASVLAGAAALPWPVRLMLPVAGMVAAWALTRWLAREAIGHGVPEVMEAVSLRAGRIRPRVVLVKAAASAMTIGTGGSVGREGPIVQIGSGIGSTLAQALGLDTRRTKLFVACGAAAGIAATFNAPIAGVIFSVEIILGSASIKTFSPIVVSAVMATAVSRWFLGSDAAFAVPTYSLESPGELLDYVALGFVAGVMGVGFVRGLYGIEDFFKRLPGPAIVAPIVGGLLVGAIGLAMPAVYGLGYDAIERELHGQMVFGVLLGMLVAKMLATSITLAGGGSGGVFAPSLFIGATLGGIAGIAANQANLWPTASPGAYALVGMAAVVAATTHAPLTAVIIIFELTGSYEIILPLMLASIIASVVSVLLQRDSIYTLKLARRGTHIGASTEATAIRGTPVLDIMAVVESTMHPSLPFDRVVARVVEHHAVYHYVVDDDGRLVGTISLVDVKNLLGVAELRHVANAHDIMSPVDLTVGTGDTISECLEQFSETENLTELPVVDSDGVLRGVIRRRDILGLYNRKLLQTQDLGMMFVTKDSGAERRDYMELPSGYGVEGVLVPTAFVGKTLAELDLRKEHELLVVGIRRRDNGGVVCAAPDPHAPLEEGTVLVVEGPKDRLAWIAGL